MRHLNIKGTPPGTPTSTWPSGLYLGMYRLYDPSAGVWLSNDPLGYIDGPNMSAYVGHNPVGMIDPLGLSKNREETGKQNLETNKVPIIYGLASYYDTLFRYFGGKESASFKDRMDLAHKFYPSANIFQLHTIATGGRVVWGFGSIQEVEAQLRPDFNKIVEIRAELEKQKQSRESIIPNVFIQNLPEEVPEVPIDKSALLLASQRKPSASVIASLHSWEKVRLKIYYTNGHQDPTIGWGHSIVGNEMEKYKDGITKEQADALFVYDLWDKSDQYVKKYVKVPLTQQQYDALVHLTYNAGQGGLRDLLRRSKLNEGNYDAVSKVLRNRFRITNNGVVMPGLIDRRNQEADLWLKGIYPRH